MTVDFEELAGETLGGPRLGVHLDASTRTIQFVDVVESVAAERMWDDGSAMAARNVTPDFEVEVREWELLEEACE